MGACHRLFESTNAGVRVGDVFVLVDIAFVILFFVCFLAHKPTAFELGLRACHRLFESTNAGVRVGDVFVLVEIAFVI